MEPQEPQERRNPQDAGERRDRHGFCGPSPTGERGAAAAGSALPGAPVDTPSGDAPSAPPEPPAGWLDILAGVLFSPRSTFERLAQQPPLGLGLLVFFLMHLVNSLMETRRLADTLARDPVFREITLAPDALVGPLAVFMLAVGGLAGLTAIALMHLGAGLLGGGGHGRAMTALAGLASLVTAFQAPLTLLEGAGVAGLWIPGLGIYLWHAYLLYRAIRAVHRLSRWRSVAALLTPFILMAAALLPALVLFGAVFFDVLQQFGDMPLP